MQHWRGRNRPCWSCSWFSAWYCWKGWHLNLPRDFYPALILIYSLFNSAIFMFMSAWFFSCFGVSFFCLLSRMCNRVWNYSIWPQPHLRYSHQTRVMNCSTLKLSEPLLCSSLVTLMYQKINMPKQHPTLLRMIFNVIFKWLNKFQSLYMI